jgi:hypothetical protein
VVSLWDLLTVICCAMPIGGALSSAQFAKVGLHGYAFAMAVGLVVGLGCAYMMRMVGKTVVARLAGASVSIRERYFRALYFAAMAWIVFASFLGAWASLALLRLFKI